MSKHTEGPWEFVGYVPTVHDALYSPRFAVTGPDGEIVAVITSTRDAGRAMSDARIISSTPELLRVAQALYEKLSQALTEIGDAEKEKNTEGCRLAWVEGAQTAVTEAEYLLGGLKEDLVEQGSDLSASKEEEKGDQGDQVVDRKRIISTAKLRYWKRRMATALLPEERKFYEEQIESLASSAP